MNKLIVLTVVLFFTGCATWDGLKKDSSDAYKGTKKAIHEATK